MKIKFAHIVIALLLLCPLFSRAEQTSETHDFSELNKESKITFSNANATATTCGVTYTCTNTAVFGVDFFRPDRSKLISINLPANGDFVTTSAIDNLKRLQVFYLFASSQQPTLQLQLSRDSIHWTNALDTEISDPGDYAKMEFDGAADRYYVRIKNISSKKKASIYKLIYFKDDGCQSKIYIPE